MKFFTIISASVLFFSFHAFSAQVPLTAVSNISFVQNNEKIYATYDLAGDASARILLVGSVEGGKPEKLQIRSVSGDVGHGVEPGPGKMLEWAYLEDYPDGLEGLSLDLNVISGGSSYSVIPVHGRLGVEVVRSVFADCLEKAATAKPSAVIIDIDSPGGSAGEMEGMVDELDLWRSANPDIKVAALIRSEAMNAAALFAIAVGRVHLFPGAVVGCQPPPSPRVDGEEEVAWIEYVYSVDLHEKIRAMAKKNGFDPFLTTAMVRHRKPLCFMRGTENQQVEIIEISRKELQSSNPGCFLSIDVADRLKLVGSEAVEVGLAGAVVNDYDELGTKLGFELWIEDPARPGVLAVEHAVKAVQASADYKGFVSIIDKAMAEFENPEGFTLELAKSLMGEIRYGAENIKELEKMFPFLQESVKVDFPEGISAIKDICEPCLVMAAKAEKEKAGSTVRQSGRTQSKRGRRRRG